MDTTETITLKQRVRQLTADHRSFDESLKPARSNLRFQDRRVADLGTQITATRPPEEYRSNRISPEAAVTSADDFGEEPELFEKTRNRYSGVRGEINFITVRPCRRNRSGWRILAGILRLMIHFGGQSGIIGNYGVFEQGAGLFGVGSGGGKIPQDVAQRTGSRGPTRTQGPGRTVDICGTDEW